MNIRNFVIIAHIDHGKSTLADRLLEMTGTIEFRQMKPQYLDQLELERERGITIKMAPVRMFYTLNAIPYTLNLIDTPGHSDFSYEVSRALEAVEGAILLVDATKGIQAQTLANFESAKKSKLKIIGAVNKIDLEPIRAEEIVKETAELIGCPPEEILKISGKTGEGVEKLLEVIVQQLPPPKELENSKMNSLSRALIFDSFYNEHKGVIAAIRIFEGELKAEDEIYFSATKEKTKIKEIGIFSPTMKPVQKLSEGEIGYIATGIKNPEKLRIGDTVIKPEVKNQKLENKELEKLALPGYKKPQPVVFVSFYPEDANEYDDLIKAFQKLKLNDSSLKLEPDSNEALGRGFKVGFLGKLHFEITAERLEKEFDIKTINSFPSVAYKIPSESGYTIIENPHDLPGDIKEIWEPIIRLEIITPIPYLGNILQLKDVYRWENIETKNLGGEKILVSAKMPLAELISDFDSQLKSISAGFASYSYELVDFEKADLVRLEIWVAGEPVPGLVRVILKKRAFHEGRKMVEKLKELLPRQQFTQALQAVCEGKIIARETIPAMKKDVTGYLYGGDRTRKMKLWKKQKKGKKRLQERVSGVKIPVKIFKDLLR